MRVYQLSIDKKPVGVYGVVTKLYSDNAYFKPIYITKQPKGNPFVIGREYKRFIHELVEPDLFPMYADKHSSWKIKCLRKVETALYLLKEKDKELHDVTAALMNKDLAVGQVWESPKITLTIQKKFGDYYVIKNQFGDVDRLGFTELAKKLEGYKLKNSVDFDSLSKSLTTTLKPFVGVAGIGALLLIIKSWMKEK